MFQKMSKIKKWNLNLLLKKLQSKLMTNLKDNIWTRPKIEWENKSLIK